MLHLIIVCGLVGNGKKDALKRVWKALSYNKCGSRISDIDNSIVRLPMF